MASSVPAAAAPALHRDHGFHRVRVARIERQTADAVSIVLDLAADQRAGFAYEAGQFCTFRVLVDGQPLLRCYSMSSAPAVDAELTVTVKQVPEGRVSTVLTRSLRAGDELEATYPAGVFRLTDGDGDVVAFAAGSGITPVFSLLKEALATTDRRVRLLYANRDLDSVIFRAELDALAARHPDRLEVIHHLDVDDGFVQPTDVAPLLEGARGPDVYVCGPTPFMDLVEAAARDGGVGTDRFHIERFTPAVDPDPGPDAAPAPTDATQVTIELDGRTATTEHRAGTTILQTARSAGLSPPFSCESGSCATCMARLVEGTAKMHVNDALTPDEVDEGWVLTCQAVPTSPSVRVVYGYEEG